MTLKTIVLAVAIAAATAPVARAQRIDGPPDAKGYPREATASFGHASVSRTHRWSPARGVRASGYPPGAVTMVR